MKYLKHFEDAIVKIPACFIKKLKKYKFTDLQIGDEVYIIGGDLSSVGKDIRLGQMVTIKKIIPINKNGNVCDDDSPYFDEYHIYMHELPIYHFCKPEDLTKDIKHPVLKKVKMEQFGL